MPGEYGEVEEPAEVKAAREEFEDEQKDKTGESKQEETTRLEGKEASDALSKFHAKHDVDMESVIEEGLFKGYKWREQGQADSFAGSELAKEYLDLKKDAEKTNNYYREQPFVNLVHLLRKVEIHRYNDEENIDYNAMLKKAIKNVQAVFGEEKTKEIITKFYLGHNTASFTHRTLVPEKAEEYEQYNKRFTKEEAGKIAQELIQNNTK